ncbi:unnamed protein product [Coregonus sp. 'balchen']|nr:unnamed protein product [Coregonus sp. 'balchen']
MVNLLAVIQYTLYTMVNLLAVIQYTLYMVNLLAVIQYTLCITWSICWMLFGIPCTPHGQSAGCYSVYPVHHMVNLLALIQYTLIPCTPHVYPVHHMVNLLAVIQYTLYVVNLLAVIQYTLYIVNLLDVIRYTLYTTWSICWLLFSIPCTPHGQSAGCHSVYPVHHMVNLLAVIQYTLYTTWSICWLLFSIPCTPHGQSAGCYSVYPVHHMVNLLALIQYTLYIVNLLAVIQYTLYTTWSICWLLFSIPCTPHGQSAGCYSVYPVRGQSAGCYSVYPVHHMVNLLAVIQYTLYTTWSICWLLFSIPCTPHGQSAGCYSVYPVHHMVNLLAVIQYTLYMVNLLDVDSAMSLIQAAKNLMNTVVSTVKASYVASTKYQKSMAMQSLNMPAISWKMKAPEKKPLVKRSSQKKHINPVQALSEFKAMDSI